MPRFVGLFYSVHAAHSIRICTVRTRSAVPIFFTDVNILQTVTTPAQELPQTWPCRSYSLQTPTTFSLCPLQFFILLAMDPSTTPDISVNHEEKSTSQQSFQKIFNKYSTFKAFEDSSSEDDLFHDEVLYANSPDNRKMPSDLEKFRFNSPFPDEFVETSTLQQSCDEYAVYEEETEHPFQQGRMHTTTKKIVALSTTYAHA